MTRAVLSVFVLAALLVSGCSYQTRDVLPPIPVSAESSTIHAADGTRITTFHAEENRRIVPLDAIPGHLRDAVIAIEDERYYQHDGVDLRAVLRALRTNTEAGDIEQGGSTITQQYVKTALLDSAERTLERKVEEATLAIQLEQEYSKDHILQLYLNTIYFGNGAYGVDAAARQYFGQPVEKLSLAQSALLAGFIQRPSTTDPYKAPEAAVARRDLVLDSMVRNRFVDEEVAAAAKQEPLKLASEVVPAAERYPAAYFVETVKQWILDDPRFGDTPQERRDLLFGGGLRIDTTVDLRMQQLAEQAVAGTLADPATSPASSMVSLEPSTGYVQAMVGGRDFFGPGANAKLNLATQGPRQAGSSFKPFVLAAALEKGISHETMLPAPACRTFPMPDEPWDVCNYGGGGGGTVNLVEGTVHSYNTLYADLILKVGAADAMASATRYGITSELRTNPAAVLGTNEVTALEMASAYGTFANRGIQVPPVLVTRITRSDGTILYQHHHKQAKAIEPGLADTVTAILEQVVARGTGTAAQLDRPAAGKTGTEDDWTDAWFVGFTPELSTAVWVGFPDTNGISMAPPRTSIRVTGGSWPAQIWHSFMSGALGGRPPQRFHPPPTTTTAAPRVTTTAAPAPQMVKVPNVVGEQVDAAVATLRAAGFLVQQLAGGEGKKGQVTGQSPPAGTSAPKGSTVSIEVASEPAPKPGGDDD